MMNKQPEQKPVAMARYDGTLHWLEPYGVGLHRFQGPLYTTPPQPKEPEQEPVAWMSNAGGVVTGDEGSDDWYCIPLYTIPYVATPRPQPKEPEQEPVAWLDVEGNGIPVPVYTIPPQRKPLTEAQAAEAWPFVWRDHEATRNMSIVRAIEAKSKEKNT